MGSGIRKKLFWIPGQKRAGSRICNTDQLELIQARKHHRYRNKFVMQRILLSRLFIYYLSGLWDIENCQIFGWLLPVIINTGS
jgi:hypothetical protein